MMGRNMLSICDECEVYIFHLRGKESDLMQKFQNEHSDHEKSTRIVSDYAEEQPEHYKDVTDDLTSTPLPEQGGFNEQLDAIIVGLQVSIGKGLTKSSDLYKAKHEAKTAIRTLVLEEIIGEDVEHTDEDCNATNGCLCYSGLLNNFQEEQRKKLGGH